MPSTYSPLRYPGGKSRFYTYVRNILILNELIGETYIEPFAGGAGLALKLLMSGDVERIVINDFDQAIYSFWYSVLYHADEFCDLLTRTEISVKEWEKQHSIFIEGDTTHRVRLGFATFFLNRTNVSGVLDGGIIGGKNQLGTYKIDARFNKVKLVQQIQRVALFKDRVVLLNRDAMELLQEDLVNLYGISFINFDPPYVNKGAQLYKNAFSKTDHQRLAELVRQSNSKWIVTYDICPLVQELYGEYRRSYLDVTYSVGASKKAKEFIFFSDDLRVPPSIKLL